MCSFGFLAASFPKKSEIKKFFVYPGIFKMLFSYNQNKLLMRYFICFYTKFLKKV